MDLLLGTIGMIGALVFCLLFYLSIKMYIWFGNIVEDAFFIMIRGRKRHIEYVYTKEDYYASKTE